MIATDGSDLSQKAITLGIALAKAVGAKVTGITVTVPFHAYLPSEFSGVIDHTIFEQRTSAAVAKRLDAVASKAAEEGVQCQTMRVSADPIYDAIIDTAGKQKCDLIVMASHGRRGLAGLILGSETVQVLTHSPIPVLVCR